MTDAYARSFPRIAHAAGVLLLIVAALAFLFWLRLGRGGPPLTDFSAYYAAGRYWSHGGDPYSAGIWSIEKTLPGFNASRFELLPFVGPPLSLLIFAAFGALPYAAAAGAWSIVILASAALLMVLPARLAIRPLGRAEGISLLLLALSCGPLVTGLSAGQAALPATAALVIAIAAAGRRRWRSMTAAMLVAAVLKPNDALVVVSVVHDFATFAGIAVAAAAYGAANVALVHGIHPALAYLNVLVQQTASERLYAYQFATASIAYGFGMRPAAAELLGTAVSLSAIAATLAALCWTRAGVVDAAAIACALFPFVLPFEHEPDIVIALLPALLVIFRADGRAWAAGAVGTVLLCANPFALTQHWPGLLFATAMAAVASLQLAALAPANCKRVRFVPVLVVPLILGIGMYAPSDRLPLWPATLPAHVRDTAQAAADAVWRNELVASRLEDRRPWVSGLRTLTLGGCACIALAMVATAARERKAKPACRPS